MLGLYAGIYRVVFNSLFKLLVGDRIQLRTGNGKVALAQDTKLTRYCGGGIAEVAGYHYRAYARLAAFLYRVYNFGTYRVYHTYKTEEYKVGFHDLGGVVGGGGIIFTVGCRKHAQRAVGKALVCLGKLYAQIVGKGNYLSVRKDVRASAYHHIGCAGSVLDVSASGLVDGRHHLSDGVKGYLTYARRLGFKIILGQTELCGVVYNGCLGGVALGYRLAAGQDRVRAEGKGFGKELFIVAVVVYDSHFVLGERAGLVRADYLSASERFNSRQLAYNGVAAGHVGNTYRKHYGNDGGKSLGDRRNCKAHGYHKGVEDRLAGEVGVHTDEVYGKYNNAYAEHEEAQYFAELIELELERRLLILRLRQRIGDLAHLGLHTGGNYHGFGASVHGCRAHVYHVLAVAERHITVVGGVYGGCGLEHRYRFAGQRGFLALEAHAFDKAAVGGDGIAGFKHNDVSGYQLIAVYRDLFAATNDL